MYTYVLFSTTVMGMTDIDDKIITRARERGTGVRALARQCEDEFMQDMRRLNVRFGGGGGGSIPPLSMYIQSFSFSFFSFLHSFLWLFCSHRYSACAIPSVFATLMVLPLVQRWLWRRGVLYTKVLWVDEGLFFCEITCKRRHRPLRFGYSNLVLLASVYDCWKHIWSSRYPQEWFEDHSLIFYPFHNLNRTQDSRIAWYFFTPFIP